MKIQRKMKIGLVLALAGGWWLAAGDWRIAPAWAAIQQNSQGGQGNQDREFHQTYDLAPNGTVGIYNSSGNVRVTTWNENRVKVDAIKHGGREEDYSRVQIEVSARPESVEIRAIYPRELNRRGNNVSVDFDVKVPRGATVSPASSSSGDVTVTGPVERVTARTSSGNVTVTDVTDTAILATSSGNINAARIGGELRANTSSGNLTINDIGSRVIAQTSSGSIRATQVHDDATATVSSGDIKLEKVGGRAIARASSGTIWINDVGGDAQADAVSDNVTVTNVRGRANVVTTSGNATIRNVSEGVRARAVSGSVSITDCKGSIYVTTVNDSITLANIDGRDVTAKSTSGNVQFTGKIQNDGHYEFETFNGNVILLIPSDSSFNLTAKTFNGSINTEFPLQLTRSTGGSVMSGTIGKGGADVRVSSFNGGVQIKKNQYRER
ncbi:MAG: DUF4097 family beta strand repeat-containing protein [Acidobacteriota bacterium]